MFFLKKCSQIGPLLLNLHYAIASRKYTPNSVPSQQCFLFSLLYVWDSELTFSTLNSHWEFVTLFPNSLSPMNSLFFFFTLKSWLAPMKQQLVWALWSETENLDCKNPLYPVGFVRNFRICVILHFWFCLFGTFDFRISVAHMDSPTVVDGGLTQMLSLVHNHGFDAELDVLFFFS